MRLGLAIVCSIAATVAGASASAQFVPVVPQRKLDEASLKRIESRFDARRAPTNSRSTFSDSKSASPQKKNLLQEATEALEKGEYERVEQICRYLLRIDSSNAVARIRLAELSWRKGKLNDARTELEKALSVQPHNSAALTMLARILLSTAEVDAAVAALKTATKYDTTNAEARLLLADLSAQSGQREQAKQLYGEVVLIQPENVRARLNVIADLANQGMVEEALKLCKNGWTILSVNKSSSNLAKSRIQLELGHLYSQLGKWTDAVDAFKAARDLNPNDSEAFQLLAITSGARNDWQSAMDFAQSFSDFDPDSLNSLVLSAWATYGSGDILEAKNRIDRAIQLSPANPDLRNLLALILIDLRRFPQAEEELNRALQIDANYLSAKMNKVMLLIFTNHLHDAATLSQQLAEQNPKDLAVTSLSAYASLLAGENDVARDMALAIIEKDQQDVIANLVLSRLLRLNGRFEEGLDRLNRLAQVTRGNSFLQCEIAQALLEKGEFVRAGEAAQFALQFGPSNQQAKTLLARALAKQGNWDGALLYLRELAARNPKELARKLELAEALIHKEDYDAALQQLEAARKLAPKAIEPVQMMQRIALLQKDRRLANKLSAEIKKLGDSR